MAHEMTFTRLIDAPAETLFRLWTDPTRMGEWFCPKPWPSPSEETEP